MSAKVRIGAVAYLNTRPLVFGMEQGLGAERIDLSYDVPAVLADRLRRHELDVALLPVIELARIPDLEIVPGLAIATAGASRSVLLVSRVALDEIRSVALDPESRTSNALTRVLFAEYWRRQPTFVKGTTDLTAMLREADAAVRIGDKALFEAPPPGARVYDLGAVWSERTGLPFVFAAWIARRGVIDREIYRTLHESRRRGTQVIDLIAEDYTWRGATRPQLVREYLTQHIRYRLGSPEVDGMRRFFELAALHGVIERAPDLRFVFERWTSCHQAATAGAALGRVTDEVRHA